MVHVQMPLTVRIGEVGSKDAAGFSNQNSSQSVARPISITDADNSIVYKKMTADNMKSADSHVKMAGYRRVSDWVDGVATVEKIPRTVTAAKLAALAVAVALVVAGVSAFIGRSNALAPDAAKEACHEGVDSKLPAGASPEFFTTNVSETGLQDHGGYLYVVSGDMRSLDVGDTVRDMTYRCEAYVDSGGSVHRIIAATTWK